MNQATSVEPKSNRQKQVQGLIYALIGTALFSIKPIFVKVAYQYGGDATAIMSLRALSSLPFYALILLMLCKKPERRTQVTQFGWQAALVGVMGYYVASYLDIAALEYISAQLERLLIFLFPSIVVILSWMFLGQKPTGNVLRAAVLGYLGIAAILFHDVQSLGEEIWKGSALAVGSAFVFAVYLMLSKSIISKMGSDLFTSIGMGSAGIAIITHLSLSSAEMSQWSFELIVLGVLLGVFCTVLPSYFVAAAMARLSPTELSITSNIGPGVTAVMAVAILSEAFTLYHFIGLCLVTFSVYSMKKSS
ncbi:DMT family transporter [Vibrio maritimus]|uniref:DMT family transporter n=1 Tax=Vibrio maritimus TaxID=990268 RepID=UPI001F3DB7A0|nr:DMT family transporter [Vibrio maritimus]